MPVDEWEPYDEDDLTGLGDYTTENNPDEYDEE